MLLAKTRPRSISLTTDPLVTIVFTYPLVTLRKQTLLNFHLDSIRTNPEEQDS